MTMTAPLWKVASSAFYDALEQRPQPKSEVAWMAAVDAVLDECAAAALAEGFRIGKPDVGRAIGRAISALKSSAEPTDG